MYNAEEKVLTVTEDQFEEAIKAETNRTVEEHADSMMGAMVYAMSGSLFCHSVWNRLTGKTKEENG